MVNANSSIIPVKTRKRNTSEGIPFLMKKSRGLLILYLHQVEDDLKIDVFASFQPGGIFCLENTASLNFWHFTLCDTNIASVTKLSLMQERTLLVIFSSLDS